MFWVFPSRRSRGSVCQHGWIIAGLTGVLVIGTGQGTALASATKPHVMVSSKTVVAGHRLGVTVSRTHRHRCVLTLRVHRGSSVIYKRKVSAGHAAIVIATTSAPGPRVLTVRCGARKASVRFTVSAASPRPTPSGSGPAADEQGFVAGTSGSQAAEPTGGQLGGGDYPNSRIADIALSKVGQNLYTPGALDHGQCKQAVNDWVAQASGNTQVMGTDYYSNYARNGGTQVSRDNVVKGDIIQLDNPGDISNYYRGMHTAVVVSHMAGSNTFDVVDSNYQLDDVVRHHAWDPYASGQKYGLRVTVWRMGTADAAPAPQPQPTPQPQPPPTYAETTGGVAHTWTNYTNAGGTQGPSIAAYQTVQIACKLQGFQVADGNTWWYRIASSPWNSAYYVSADAFYNNGHTSGSLVGTPWYDSAVRNC
jgi:hypothetical protein